MILNLYIARRFLLALAMVFAATVGIALLIDMVEQLRRFGGSPLGLGGAFQMALLRLPASLYMVLPLMVMLATLALFLRLGRSSELVVARASGRSALHFVAAPALAALLVGGLALALFNPIVAATSTQYDERSARIAGGDDSVLSVGRDGLWMREAIEEGQRVIHAQHASGYGARLFDVTFLTFAQGTGPVSRIDAAVALLTPGAWELRDAKQWQLGATNPERESAAHDVLSLATDLDESRVRDGFSTPGSVGIWQLPAFIDALEQAGLSAREHRVWLHMELAMPLFLSAMVLVGAAFTMRHPRAAHRGLLVLAALLSGFAAFFLRNLAQVLGENGHIPAALAAWSPPIIALLLAMALLLHLEEG